MKNHLRTLRSSLTALRSVWKGALPALVVPGSDAESGVAAMSDAGLVRVVDALSALARAVAALQALVAGEVARRSRPELGHEGLASAQGFPSPAALLAQSAGVPVSEALKLVTVGQATTGRQGFTGERMPSPHPHVAAAVRAGQLSVPAAALITRMLDRVARRVLPEKLTVAEKWLVARAAELTFEELVRAVKVAEAKLDLDGVEPREDALRAERSLSITEEQSGMIAMRGRFDPVTGAPIKAAIEALVAAELRRARDAFGSSGACICPEGTPRDACPCIDPATAERRSFAQMRADALADLARHAIGCEETAIAASGTVVARMEMADLRDPNSVGVASIDGIDQPISASSARCLAASAGIIPFVLGGNSAPLDLGLSQRLFTKLQKLALAERDGGCAHPGCTRPPSFTEAHHIRWWERDSGPTAVENGVLLCSYHHHLLHRGEWVIKVVDNRTWFIPPVHIDPDQRPRPGNSSRRSLERMLDEVTAIATAA